MRTVHPRRRGERVSRREKIADCDGSSPQARGTRDRNRNNFGGDRFIPAGAGNAGRCEQLMQGMAVHPRRRGERIRGEGLGSQEDGSSPQARGTLIGETYIASQRRFIPAGAGNACQISFRMKNSTVHPRRRGERILVMFLKNGGFGSSPQARGTRYGSRIAGARTRFIPAGAGNASEGRRESRRGTVHPRRRGERPGSIVDRNVDAGSSPQARGTLAKGDVSLEEGRFIPAGAGNAARACRGYATASVHPRRRGERTIAERLISSAAGSSPQARGTRLVAHARTREQRFIPAGAGNA